LLKLGLKAFYLTSLHQAFPLKKEKKEREDKQKMWERV